MSDTVAACPYHSVDTLSRLMRACAFPKADIVQLARRLRGGDGPAAAAEGDAAALKVEKNALALVFIPEIMDMAGDFLATCPGQLVTLVDGRPGLVDMGQLRGALKPGNPDGGLCNYVYLSLRNVFHHVVGGYLHGVEQGAAAGDAAMIALRDGLLARYGRALSLYHGHTAVAATHFNPGGHILAGVNTALFFILRALSALTVLGRRRLGRPLTRAELAAGVEDVTPLLLTIARCHLELLLELEVPLGKGDDLFLTGLDGDGYVGALADMFVVTVRDGTPRLDLAEPVLNGLRPLAGDKPRTGCPALYASTGDNVNAIVALVRHTERVYVEAMAAAGLAFTAPAAGSSSAAPGAVSPG